MLGKVDRLPLVDERNFGSLLDEGIVVAAVGMRWWHRTDSGENFDRKLDDEAKNQHLTARAAAIR